MLGSNSLPENFEYTEHTGDGSRTAVPWVSTTHPSCVTETVNHWQTPLQAQPPAPGTCHATLCFSEFDCFILLFGLATHILVPRPGFKPVSPVLEVWSLNHWTAKEALSLTVLDFTSKCDHVIPVLLRLDLVFFFLFFF